MPQVKIYGNELHLNECRLKLSNAIHECIMETLLIPQNKRFHRFINLNSADFIYPDDKTNKYIIIEIFMMIGRTTETKKRLIKGLFKRISCVLDIVPGDIEICIMESDPSN